MRTVGLLLLLATPAHAKGMAEAAAKLPRAAAVERVLKDPPPAEKTVPLTRLVLSRPKQK